MKEADAANMTQQECQYIQGVWPQQHKMAMNWEKSHGQIYITYRGHDHGPTRIIYIYIPNNKTQRHIKMHIMKY